MKNCFKAIKKEDEQAIIDCIAAGADPNSRKDNGRCPIHTAAYSYNDAIIRLLLEAGADPNARMNHGITALHILAKAGVMGSTLSDFLAKGADINVRDDSGRTPLYAACQAGYILAVFDLLEAGADIGIADNDGLLPSQAACMEDYAAWLNVGRHKSTSENLSRPGLRYPLHAYALMRPDTERLRRYLSSGADPNEKLNGATPLHVLAKAYYPIEDSLRMLLEFGASLEATDDDGNTPLHMAAMRDNLENVQCLLMAGANQLARNLEGKTPVDVSGEEATDFFHNPPQMVASPG